MLPVILVAVGAYLIGDSLLEDKKYAKGGMSDGGEKAAKKRLEELRKELRAERISYGELAELESLKEYIDEDDVELRQAAGIPEFEDEDEYAKGGEMAKGGEVEDELYVTEFSKGQWTVKDKKNSKGNYSLSTKKENAENLRQELIDNPSTLKYYRSNEYANGGEMAKGIYSKADKDFYEFREQLTKKYGVNFKNSELSEEDFEKLNELKQKKNDGLAKKYPIENANKMAKGGKLVGKQKNLDVNKNGKLDAQDFKMLRGEKMADGGETKMPYKEFEETLREYEIEGGFGKTKEKGYEMYYLPNGNPYLNTKFNHRNKKKAYQQYVKMDR